MTGSDGYAIVSPSGESWAGVGHRSLTTELCCSHTQVDVIETPPGEPWALSAAVETVCVPLDAPGQVVADGSCLSVPRGGIVRFPAGVQAELSAAGQEQSSGEECRESTGNRGPDRAASQGTPWLVVGARAEPEPTAAPVVVDPGAVAFAVPSTSDVAIARLTAPLSCTGMKVNLRRLEPGQSVPYHTEGEQEELFVPLDGPGAVRLAGDTRRVPLAGIVRVAPPTPRGVVNDGPEDRIWFMVGAPPTGGPDEWDPGAVILDLEDDTGRSDEG